MEKQLQKYESSIKSKTQTGRLLELRDEMDEIIKQAALNKKAIDEQLFARCLTNQTREIQIIDRIVKIIQVYEWSKLDIKIAQKYENGTKTVTNGKVIQALVESGVKIKDVPVREQLYVK